MKYVEIPYVKKKVSQILYGTAMQPFLDGGDGNELLDAMFAMGINTFDIARNYKLAEKSVGKWMEERNLRDQVVILSKCAHPDDFGNKRVSEKAIREDFAVSSEYLRTNYIDIYILHRDDPSVLAGNVVEWLNAMYAEGKIGAFGGSNWTHQRIEEANEYAYAHNLIPFTVSSPNYGLADQKEDPWGGGCVTISGPSNEAAREWYQKNQMPVIAYSSLGRGLFSGKLRSDEIKKAAEIMDEAAMKGYVYPENFERLRRCERLAKEKNMTVAQIAMAFIFNQKLNTLAVVSTSRPSCMKENIEASELLLTEQELKYLDLQIDI